MERQVPRAANRQRYTPKCATSTAPSAQAPLTAPSAVPPATKARPPAPYRPKQAGGQQRQHKRGRRSAGLVQLVFPVKVLGKLRFGFGKLLGKALVRMGKRKFLLFAKQSLEECALVSRRGLRNICLLCSTTSGLSSLPFASVVSSPCWQIHTPGQTGRGRRRSCLQYSPLRRRLAPWGGAAHNCGATLVRCAASARTRTTSAAAAARPSRTAAAAHGAWRAPEK